MVKLSRRSACHACVAWMGAPLAARAGGDLLRVSYNDDYAPYSYTEVPEGPVLGVLPQVLQLAFALALPGLRLEHTARPWRRAQSRVESGQADALCTFASDDRRRYALFNRVPVVTLEPHLFFSAAHPRRRELEQLTSRDALKAFRLVDQRGNQWAEQQFADFPNVEWVTSHDASYRMVLSGHVDVHVVLSPLVTLWRLRKLNLHQAIVSAPAPFVAPAVPFHLGIRKALRPAQPWLDALDGQLQQPRVRERVQAIERGFM